MKVHPSIDFNEITRNDDWELFARDYLAQLGFVIEVEPGRGHDQGKDLIVSEQLKGQIRTRKFTWLVSCKHFASSDRAVGQDEERNIIERLAQHKAEGFIGFYSTLASSSLIERLKDITQNGHIEAYEIIDRKKIEGRFYKRGLTELAIRYFPESYKRLRPIQVIWSDYEPLYCEICGEDVLKGSMLEPYRANILYAKGRMNTVTAESNAFTRTIHSIHVACKKGCDRALSDRLWHQGFITLWTDLGDRCNPMLFMKNAVSYMNILFQREPVSKDAHERMKAIYLIIAQRVLREVTDEDRERCGDSAMFEGL